MITSTEAAMQIDRMEGLDYYPRERAAQRELRLAAETADTLEILIIVVNEWISNYTVAPKPADLRRLIAPYNSERATETRRRIEACTECNGTGYIFITRGGYSGCKPCAACSPSAVEPKTVMA